MGRVRIEVMGEWLRLRWSYQGKRLCLSPGLPNTKTGRVVAMNKATLIEGDLITGNYDDTLRKYKAQKDIEDDRDGIAIVKLFEQFTSYRAKSSTVRTMGKYAALSKRVNRFFQGMSVTSIDEAVADRFSEALNDLAPLTRKNYLVLVSACWDFGIKQELVKENPWGEVPKDRKSVV